MPRRRDLRAQVLARDGKTCAQCGADCSKPVETGWIRKRPRKDSAEVDHEIPLWIGGKDTPANAQVLCPKCHKKKGATETTLRAKMKRGAKKVAKHLARMKEKGK
jgi:5-methylcytosine-specific restriction endonuclease McrA